MFHNVYANDRSICCKAGDGVSRAASPDTCWTPPQPSPVPVPYPNTAFARDLTNGTKTVFIQGTEVAKKDVSFFATSTGDEGATNSCGQGLLTGVIRGKAYFFSWSMNVKAEKHNVCRHQDMMGHNHGSFPSNTPLFPFVERGWTGHDCKKEEDRIERACKKDVEEEDADKKKLRLPKKKRFKLKPKLPGPGGKPGPWHWTDDHCDGLNFPSGALNADEFLKQFKETAEEFTKLDTYLDGVKDWAIDYAKNAALKTGGKVLAKAGLKQLGGSSVPLAGNIIMGLWTVYDVVSSIDDVSQIKTLADDLIEDIGALKDQLGKFGDLLDRYKKGEGGEKLLTDAMDILATVNPCVRARKCNLVPYSNKGGPGSKVEHSKGGGCCAGQTGHHLIPETMVRDGACPGYKHSEAPTVCVEGTNQSMGSHGRIHGFMNKLVQAGTKNGKIPMDKAIDAAVASHVAAFPLSRCSPKCIKAQLEAYYNKTCPGASLNSMTGSGRIAPSDAGGNGGGTP